MQNISALAQKIARVTDDFEVNIDDTVGISLWIAVQNEYYEDTEGILYGPVIADWV